MQAMLFKTRMISIAPKIQKDNLQAFLEALLRIIKRGEYNYDKITSL